MQDGVVQANNWLTKLLISQLWRFSFCLCSLLDWNTGLGNNRKSIFSSTTPKTSPKKQRKSAVPAAEPKKNSVINGGGGASGGKMKEISVGNGVVGYKMKREFYAIHTAEIVGKAEIQMTKVMYENQDWVIKKWIKRDWMLRICL